MFRWLTSLLMTAAMALPALGLIPNGDFQSAGADGKGTGWSGNSEHVTWVVENGNRYVRLTSPEPGKLVTVYRTVDVKPEHKAYELTFRVRFDNVQAGEKSWFDARTMLNFKDASGKIVASPAPPYFKGNSKGQWRPVTTRFAVPENAKVLEVIPALFQAKSGTIEFDDFVLKTIDANTLPKKVDMSSPVVPAPPAEKLPKELRVVGNRLVNSDGEQVWLQGLSVDSLQWNPNGERTVPTIEYAIDKWNANCIRLAVKEEMWWGQNEQQKDGGTRYREVIDSAINTAAGRGAYIVVDLHRFRAPEQKHADFWVEFAEKYKNHPAVIFELFNEPYGISWETWRNGGPVDKPKAKEDVATESTEGDNTFMAVGLQQMLDAVRSTGARNVVVIGALDYSYDLSGILKGYAIDERGGNGIVYSTHVYPWKKNWKEKFLEVAEHHPIFMGEVGCPEKWSDFPFIKNGDALEKLGPDCTWPADMIATIQEYKLNWTAFSFHPKCGPKVIEDWDYTPTKYWGVFVKDALAGKQFERTRMR